MEFIILSNRKLKYDTLLEILLLHQVIFVAIRFLLWRILVSAHIWIWIGQAKKANIVSPEVSIKKRSNIATLKT